MTASGRLLPKMAKEETKVLSAAGSESAASENLEGRS